MNVVIISTSDSGGGAAKAAYRLFSGLNQIGINTHLIVKNKTHKDSKIIQANITGNEKYFEHINITNKIKNEYIKNNRTDLTNTLYSFPYPGYDLSNLQIIKQADIINLHWVSDFQSVESIAKIILLGKPIVWTLHDQNPFTGGCHIVSGCDKFKAYCHSCPQLRIDPFELPYNILKNKIEYFQPTNLTIVSPSKWLASLAKESKLFRSSKIFNIPNAVEDDIYHPINKRKAKERLGIKTDTITLYFGAYSPGANIKGFDHLLRSLDFCMGNATFSSLANNGKVLLITTGLQNHDINELIIPFKSFGYLKSDKDLNEVYNASDITLLPSLIENFPNIILESFSTGTPVIAYNTGGIPEIVKNNKTGKLITCFDTSEFGKSILLLVLNEKKRMKLGKLGRKLIKRNYTIEHQANQYKRLFRRLTKSRYSENGVIDSDCPGLDVGLDLMVNKNLLPLFEKYS